MPSAIHLPYSADQPDFYVNDGKLEHKDVKWLNPTALSTDLKEMREKLEEDGYLFLKGLLPRDDVLEARKNYFQYLASTGLLQPGSPSVEGIFNSSRPPADYPGTGTGVQGTNSHESQMFYRLSLEAHSEPWYSEYLCKHPVLIEFIKELSGWGENTHGLERTLLRNNVPGNAAIGVHYDFIFLRHGNDSVLTCWVPIGDITVEGGGLIYLEDGHQLGRDIENAFTEKAIASGLTEDEARFAFNKNMMAKGVLTQNAKAFADEHDKQWLVSSYEAGDVVIHKSHMIHASTKNHDASNVIRLATDLRFVDRSKSWDERWAKVYEDNDGL